MWKRDLLPQPWNLYPMKSRTKSNYIDAQWNVYLACNCTLSSLLHFPKQHLNCITKQMVMQPKKIDVSWYTLWTREKPSFLSIFVFPIGKGKRENIGKRIGNFCVNSILDFYCFIEYYALIMYYRDIIHLKWRLYNINMKYISILAGLKYSFEKRIIS